MPAILCPSCNKLINSDVPQCPYCGQSRPGMFGFTTWMRKIGIQVDFSRSIVAICVVLYVLCLLVDPSAIFKMEGFLGFLSPSGNASLLFGMTGFYPVFLHGHWWTLFTAIYLHGGLLHIFFNTMWIRQLGPMVEEMFGPMRLFIIFTVAGAMGFILSAVMGNAHTLGASGSIFGLLAAAIVYGRQTGSIAFTQQFVQWAAILFIFGFIFPGVDNWAHGGGVVGGYAMAYLFSKESEREGVGAYLGAAVCLILTLGGFALQLFTVLGLI